MTTPTKEETVLKIETGKKTKNNRTKRTKIELQKRRKRTLISLSVIAFLVLIGGIWLGVDFWNQTKILSRNLKTVTTERDKYLSANNLIKEELSKMKSRISGIKNNDDLLRRDIELYIRFNYNKIPKVVAKTIAFNIVTESKKQEMSPELVVGIIQVESVFNPMQVGKKTKYGYARGLMQVMPEWVKKFGLKSRHDLHDIDTNIKSGIRVFNIHLKEANGNISKGLYLYVNKDKAYINKVYTAVGKFVSFRSTVDDDEKSSEQPDIPNEPEKKEMKKESEIKSDKGTKKSS